MPSSLDTWAVTTNAQFSTHSEPVCFYSPNLHPQRPKSTLEDYMFCGFWLPCLYGNVPVPRILPSGKNVLHEAERGASAQMLTVNSSTRDHFQRSQNFGLPASIFKNNYVSTIRKRCRSVLRFLSFFKLSLRKSNWRNSGRELEAGVCVGRLSQICHDDTPEQGERLPPSRDWHPRRVRIRTWGGPWDSPLTQSLSGAGRRGNRE